MRNIGLVGCGKIGAPVIRAVQAGEAGANTITHVLSRTAQSIDGLVTTTDAEAFLATPFDLVIDAATGHWLAEHGEQALRNTDVWTVNAGVLCDHDIRTRLEETGKQHGHRLRLLSGAIAGLDGVATACVDSAAQVVSSIDIASSEEPRTTLFEGSAVEASRQFPDSVNVAVAAAIGGPGLDKMTVKVMRPHVSEDRELSLSIESKFGEFEAVSRPRVVPGQVHTVSACIVAALLREDQVIWVG